MEKAKGFLETLILNQIGDDDLKGFRLIVRDAPEENHLELIKMNPYIRKTDPFILAPKEMFETAALFAPDTLYLFTRNLDEYYKDYADSNPYAEPIEYLTYLVKKEVRQIQYIKKFRQRKQPVLEILSSSFYNDSINLFNDDINKYAWNMEENSLEDIYQYYKDHKDTILHEGYLDKD